MLCTAVFAQGPIITHYDKKGIEVKEQAAAYFYRIIAKDEQVPGLFKYVEFYSENDKPKAKGTLSKMNSIGSKIGPFSTFYINGQLHKRQVYDQKHKLIDSAICYYPNGTLYSKTYYPKPTDPFKEAINSADTKDDTEYILIQDSLGNKLAENGNGILLFKDLLKNNADFEQGTIQNHKKNGEWTGKSGSTSFTETWKEGSLITGVSEDSTGSTIAYDEHTFYKSSDYLGGINRLRTEVANNYQYPHKAIDAGVNGTLMVAFVVEKDGSMTDFKIIKDLGYGTGEALIKVLKQLRTKWSPAIMRGRNVRVAYHLPMTLNLQN